MRGVTELKETVTHVELTCWRRASSASDTYSAEPMLEENASPNKNKVHGMSAIAPNCKVMVVVKKLPDFVCQSATESQDTIGLPGLKSSPSRDFHGTGIGFGRLRIRVPRARMR